MSSKNSTQATPRTRRAQASESNALDSEKSTSQKRPSKTPRSAKASRKISESSTLDSEKSRPKAKKSNGTKVQKQKKPKALSKADIETLRARFLARFGNAKTELIYHNLYELLVCVMLSAQCTDKRVNIVTPALFAAYPTPKALSKARLDDVKEYIKSVSFFNNKAKHLIEMAQAVMERFNGEIPTTQEELKSLSGVGQKTANVVLIEYFEQNYMAVDTHVFRVSHRLGLSGAKSALETERELTQILKNDLSVLHQAFVLFGRYTCKALKPLCEECFVSEFCQNKSNFKPS